MREALEDAELTIFAVPSHGLRETLERAKSMLPEAPIVSASKGIETGSLKLPSEIFEEQLADHLHPFLAYLSGPSFAAEIASDVPTAVVVASKRHDTACTVQEALSSDRLRAYTSDDVVGVELGGALKNVVAIAAGAVEGLGFGANSRAALITRGLAEISRLAIRRGAHPLTLSGLAGMGDLVLTCTGDLSRNRRVGFELARGRPLAEIVADTPMIAEGIRTTASAYELAQREGIEMPIVQEVHRVLYEGKSPIAAMETLMARTLRPERDG